MAGIEWTVASSLTSSEGTLDLFDGATLNGFVPVVGSCQVGLTVRATPENIPQGDGDVLHARFKGGYVFRPTYQLFDSGAVAMGSARREMYESLVLHLNAIMNEDGRYTWSPSGTDDRMLDGVRLLEWPDPSAATDVLKQVTFALDTRFPYAMTAAQATVTVAGSDTVVTNGGNVPFFAVVKVNGAFTGFTMTNNSVVDESGNPLQIVYDDSLPDAADVASGDYIEITTFGGGKAYLNGNGANMKKGFDVLASDFFPLAPGDNHIDLVGADSADFLVNDAWGL